MGCDFFVVPNEKGEIQLMQEFRCYYCSKNINGTTNVAEHENCLREIDGEKVLCVATEEVGPNRTIE